MGHAIFISYRRDDTEGEAGRLFDDLTRAFGETCVFMDVAGINPGDDFRKAIEDNVVSCGVLLAVIGPNWVTIKDASGNARLDNPNDFVRLEIGSALKRSVAVIPVLVHDAKMPHPEALPDDLKDLCYRNSVELSHPRWNSDVALLTNALKAYVKSTPASEQEPVHATVSVQLPPPRSAEAEQSVPKRGIPPVLQGAGIAVLLVLAALAYFTVHGSKHKRAQRDSSASAAAVGAAGGSAEAASAGNSSGIRGSWVLPNVRHGDNLSRLEIGADGNRLLMHAWGACQPDPCDWGTRPAIFDGQSATATFTLAHLAGKPGEVRVTTINVQPKDGDLEVLAQNTFTLDGSSHSNQSRGEFVPAP